MNQTLEQETFEEVSNYKLTFENNDNLITEEPSQEDENMLPSEELDKQGADELSSEEEDINIIEKNDIEECTSLVVQKEHRLLVAQNMFKKSIKVSIKSFLISLSLSFLNLFI